MAKFTMALFLMAALLVSTHAFMPTTPRRALQQSFTCTQARALNNRCKELFTCIVQRSSNLRSMEKAMMNMCNSCVAATKTCPKNNALPSACSSGLRFAPVAACIRAAVAPRPAPKAAPKPASG